jgi:hypothetical protein
MAFWAACKTVFASCAEEAPAHKKNKVHAIHNCFAIVPPGFPDRSDLEFVGVNLTRPAVAATAAVAVIPRQSMHSVAGEEPNEKLLNSWPHRGQLGISNFSFLRRASSLRHQEAKDTRKIISIQVI